MTKQVKKVIKKSKEQLVTKPTPVDSPILKKKQEEQLSKELSIVASEILERNEEEQMKKTLTNPSAIALEQTKHSAGEGVNRVKKNVRQLFILYLTNQYVARAISIRSNTIVSRGYDIFGGDKKGKELCLKLIDDSGDINLFSQLATNTDIAGDGFLEPIYNQNKTKILKLKHVHPMTLSFKKDGQTDKILIDKNKEPVGYVQIFIDKNGKEQEKDIPKDRVKHFRFNTLGDEFTGLSAIQSGYDTIVRLMNMEYAAAESAVKIANPIIVAKCNTKSPHQIASWGTILGKISGQEQLFIPEGMTIELLSPGKQNFNDYADYFLNSVVATFGIPKGVLLGSSEGSSNRSESIVLTRHFYSLIRSNQKSMEKFFNAIFVEYGKLANFDPPKIIFEDVAEESEANAQSAITLFQAGIIDRDEAREMIGLEVRGDVQKTQKTVKDEIKDSDMDTFFPAEPGSPTGSQKNVKSKQKASEFSEVSPNTK